MRKEELRDLARRLSSGPSDPTLYERLLDAAAVTRCGLELLQQLAEELEGREPPLRAVHDPAQRAAFRPGERLLDPDGEEARSDLLDQAAGQLRLSLGAGSAEDLQELLGAMTAAGLASQLEGTLADFLDALPEEALAGLRRTARPAVSEEGRSALERVAAAMLPHPAGEDGDLLLFAGDRLRDALSLLRTGREMLHETLALLPPLQGEAVEPAAFVPGRPVRLLGLAVPTDPLELLHAELSALLASTPDAFAEVETWLASFLGSLDRQGRPVGALASYLTGEVLTDLAAALGLPAEVPRESPEAPPRHPPSPPPARPARRGRVNHGQLVRALERAPRQLPTIEAAWTVLTAPEQPFARRFAAGVLLCRKTRELVRDRPKEAGAWAARVGTVAEHLVGEGAGEGEEFQARMAAFLATFAGAHIGNALRVEGHLRAAERFFLPWEEDDLLGLRAEYLALKATLRRAERRFAEALDLLETAERIAERRDFPGASELLAQTRIAAARTLSQLSEFSAAADHLRRALEAAKPDAVSDRVRCIALQNLAECLSSAGALNEAGRLLPEIEELSRAIGLQETDELRIAWIRSRVRLPEDRADAREMLRAVRNRFIELGFLYDAALASLELAVWHAEEIAAAAALPDQRLNPAHLTAIRQLAAESAQFFVGADVTPEALAALALFQYVSLSAVPSPLALRKVERLLRQATLG